MEYTEKIKPEITKVIISAINKFLGIVVLQQLDFPFKKI